MKILAGIMLIFSAMLLVWSIKNLFKTNVTHLELCWCFSIGLNLYNVVINIISITK